MKPIESYRDLVVWQQAMDLVVMCYRVTERFPSSEQFGLTFQVRKSAVSIPSNIAEGYQRRSTGAYLQHLSIASGSQGELGTQLEIARRLGYLPVSAASATSEANEEVGRLLYGLSEGVRRKPHSPRRAYSLIVPDDPAS
jgi:four helix bundle protein